ncbi:MAG: hypothetical protein E7051_02370 [Lentisphaerae bacterium]|nr:hypothetical protein [Lentisphaerota bacterium]
MLEITNLRDGAVLDRNFGTETADYLEIKVQGIADPQAEVKVNGETACRHDRNFCATVKLTKKINEITVVADSYFGKEALTITVAWDKNSYKRYNFFFDDCSFFLRSLALNRPASIFDEMFLGRLKQIHDKYGSFFTLNLFFHDDHHDFAISDMPEDYKAEFQANSDWLRMSFHAHSEFPDRPYQHADAKKLAADYDEVYNEVCRFAGKECFIAPMVIHWSMTNPENFSVLKARGTNCLAAGYLGSIAHIGEAHAIQVTDIGFHYEKDVACYICDKHIFYDRYHDLFLLNSISCCNYDDVDVLEEKFAKLADDPRDTVNIMSHEQYSYPDYFNYIPNHLDRVETACRLATEAGYKPAWFSNGILGNTAWDK